MFYDFATRRGFLSRLSQVTGAAGLLGTGRLTSESAPSDHLMQPLADNVSTT